MEQFVEYLDSESESDDENEITEIQYSCVIIDDFANDLKNNDIQRQLNKMLIKQSASFMLYVHLYITIIFIFS